MDEKVALRESERKAIASVAGLVNSLLLDHYFVDNSTAYQAFVSEVMARNPNALETVQSLCQDIDALDAVKLVLENLKHRIDVDVSLPKLAMN